MVLLEDRVRPQHRPRALAHERRVALALRVVAPLLRLAWARAGEGEEAGQGWVRPRARARLPGSAASPLRSRHIAGGAAPQPAKQRGAGSLAASAPGSLFRPSAAAGL